MADTKPESKAETFEEIHAAEIREKLLAGLTKDQAIAVVRAQLAHDEAIKKAAKAAK
jgi:hypothetical protein